jgi:hypothetical protein
VLRKHSPASMPERLRAMVEAIAAARAAHAKERQRTDEG